MRRNGLFLMIVLAVGGVSAVHAQSAQDKAASGNHAGAAMSTGATGSDSGYDGRWYVAPTIGGYYNDTNRNTNSRQLYYGLGFGRFVSPSTSIDIFADHTSRDQDHSSSHWYSNTLGAAARFYGGSWNVWRPYLLAGVMGSYHMNRASNGWSPAAEIGVGLSKTWTKNLDFRIETAYRYDWDSNSQPAVSSGFGDYLLGISLVARFGEPAAPPPPPPPPAAPAPPPKPTCDQLDSDHDGVNNCNDKCPDTPSGTIVGPDGCQQKVVIDLRGVNFKFDRPKPGETDIAPTLQEPTAQSMSILDQAVDTLKRYPQVKVEVAGYTDSIGSASYNQKLSERRARIVYNYLVSHGISADRLEGPVGHGENDPIDTNSTKAGRSRNRRTELQVQNSNVQNNGGMQDNSDGNGGQ